MKHENGKRYREQGTPWAIKRSQLISVCNFVKNQWILMPFYSARNARIASAVLATAIPSVRPSVRLSVCLSVRPSHAGIASKRRHVARCSLHRWIAKSV